MQVRTDVDAIAEFETDEGGAFHAAGVEAVYFPEGADDVAGVLREAYERGVTVTVSGGGTGLTGGRVATGGGWVLSTAELREARGLSPEGPAPTVLDRDQFGRNFRLLLDEAGEKVIAPAGITLELLGAMLPDGLIYPPDPTERTATLGGTIATNASGARTFHYGATRNWVQALEVVLPTGEPLVIERGDVTAQEGRLRFAVGGRDVDIPVPTYAMPPVKNAAGLYAAPGMDLVDLFVGAEGILGVVTQARLKLVRLDSEILAEIAFFDTLDDAFGFVADLRQAKAEGLPVLSIEYFDGHALNFMQHPTVRGSHAAAIYVEIAGSMDDAEALLVALEEHNVAQDWFAEDAAERQEQKDFRHSLPDGVNAYLRRQGSYKLGTDFAVPAEQFPTLLALSQEAAASFREQFPHDGEHTATWGHLGNYHLHFNFLARNAEELAVAKRLYAGLAQQAAALGGTVSAEHGVGKKTAEIDGVVMPYLQIMYGEQGLREIAAIKQALDPKWILNPGNMVPGPV
ncbi:MAG: FAD-binding oxidoreductase [Armatimonadetes bacterium]|nr:FAD-binding oxidoreductase [Armatimonadota bacterium]